MCHFSLRIAKLSIMSSIVFVSLVRQCGHPCHIKLDIQKFIQVGAPHKMLWWAVICPSLAVAVTILYLNCIVNGFSPKRYREIADSGSHQYISVMAQ